MKDIGGKWGKHGAFCQQDADEGIVQTKGAENITERENERNSRETGEDEAARKLTATVVSVVSAESKILVANSCQKNVCALWISR